MSNAFAPDKPFQEVLTFLKTNGFDLRKARVSFDGLQAVIAVDSSKLTRQDVQGYIKAFQMTIPGWLQQGNFDSLDYFGTVKLETVDIRFILIGVYKRGT